MLFNYNNCKNCKINKRDTFTLRQKMPIEICYIIGNYYPHCAKCSNMISQEEQFIHRIKALYGDGLSKIEYQLRWFSKHNNKPLTYDFILDDDRVLKKEIDKLFDAVDVKKSFTDKQCRLAIKSFAKKNLLLIHCVLENFYNKQNARRVPDYCIEYLMTPYKFRNNYYHPINILMIFLKGYIFALLGDDIIYIDEDDVNNYVYEIFHFE